MSADRQRLIRVIHVARRELAMDEDTYRDILQRIGNARSAADLSASNLQRVLDHMKSCGFKVRPKNGRRVMRPLASDPESQKIRAMWLFMHELGVVRDPSERALAAYVKRISGVDALQWTDGRQTLAIIESLKKWCMRYLLPKVESMAMTIRALPLTEVELASVNAAIHESLSRRTYDPTLAAWDAMQSLLKKYQEADHGR